MGNVGEEISETGLQNSSTKSGVCVRVHMFISGDWFISCTGLLSKIDQQAGEPGLRQSPAEITSAGSLSSSSGLCLTG